MERRPAASRAPHKAEEHPETPGIYGPGPWPSADGLRLALLAQLQDAETVDLVDFFRQAYPKVLGNPPSAPLSKREESGERRSVKDA